MRGLRPDTRMRSVSVLLFLAAQGLTAQEPPDHVRGLLKTYCASCHRGKTALAKVDVTRLGAAGSLSQDRNTWARVLARVRGGEMPPKGSPAPGFDEREKFVSWVDTTLRNSCLCGGPGSRTRAVRRLNREEYSATIRDLLNIQISAGHALPADGAGGEGFDNAAETLFLSPIHAEKYLEAARQALEYAAKDPRARAVFPDRRAGRANYASGRGEEDSGCIHPSRIPPPGECR